MDFQIEGNIAVEQRDVVDDAKKMLELVRQVPDAERRARLGSDVHDIVLEDHASIMAKPCSSLDDLSAAQILDEIAAELREFMGNTGY